MKKVTIGKKKVDFPERLDELSPRQYEYYCFLVSAMAAGCISLSEFKKRWLFYLAGFGHIPPGLLRKDLIEETRKHESLIDGFIITDSQSGDKRPDIATPMNLLKEYRGFRGPGDMLNGMTFGEFMECSALLDQMHAVPAETDPDESAQEVMECISAMTRIMYHIPEDSPVPEVLKFHAPLLFGNVVKVMVSEPITIGGKEIDLRIIFRSSGKKRPDDKTGWAGVAFEVASAGVFGPMDKVEKTDMWTVLMYLYKCKFEHLYEQSKNKS